MKYKKSGGYQFLVSHGSVYGQLNSLGDTSFWYLIVLQYLIV